MIYITDAIRLIRESADIATALIVIATVGKSVSDAYRSYLPAHRFGSEVGA